MPNPLGNDLPFKKTCRGSGKVFSLVKLPAECAGHTPLVTSVLEDGTAVPAKMVPFDKDGHWVVIVCVLDVPQTIHITASTLEGTTRTWRRRVLPRVAKLSSQVHTFLKDEEMERVRNFDLQQSFGEYYVKIARWIQRPDGTDTLHAETVCITDDRDALSDDVSICAIDREGKVVSIGETIVMRSTMAPEPRVAGVYERHVQFALAIPGTLTEFAIWVHTASERNPLADGVLAVQSFEAAWWRDNWRTGTLPAAQNTWYTEDHRFGWEQPCYELELQRRQAGDFDTKFSIVVPLFNTPRAYLDEMIESVLAQTYGNFELILVNASPQNTALAKAVTDWQRHDGRIVVHTLDENLGITQNTNEGIRVATGDFVCFLDHDDTLAPEALYCYASALVEYPTTDMLYSDEDHYENGEYKHPYFKPDWEPDLILGMNYVCHFLAVRKSVLDSLEPSTSEFDGSQDHHLVLRVSEVARNIYHCRRVLYHWRITPQSTASSIEAKPYAVDAGLRAVQAHLDRMGIAGRAVYSKRIPTRYEVEYELTARPLVSIIIPNKDAIDMLDRCLRSIAEKTDYDNYEVLVIENNSTDEATFAYYEQAQRADERVHVVFYEGGFNYAKINNFGVEHARGEYLLLLNNDTEVITGNWLTVMLSLCMREGTAVVGPKLLYPDGTIQHAGVISLPGGPDHVNRFLPSDEPLETLQLRQDVSAVTGACLFVRRSVYEEVGGLNPEFEVDYNDIDFCWRVLAAGYLLVYEPGVELYHYESVSRGFHASKASQLRFEREKGMLRMKWPEHFAFSDPMGNPNFFQYSQYYKLP